MSHRDASILYEESTTVTHTMRKMSSPHPPLSRSTPPTVPRSVHSSSSIPVRFAEIPEEGNEDGRSQPLQISQVARQTQPAFGGALFRRGASSPARQAFIAAPRSFSQQQNGFDFSSGHLASRSALSPVHTISHSPKKAILPPQPSSRSSSTQPHQQQIQLYQHHGDGYQTGSARASSSQSSHRAAHPQQNDANPVMDDEDDYNGYEVPDFASPGDEGDEDESDGASMAGTETDRDMSVDVEQPHLHSMGAIGMEEYEDEEEQVDVDAQEYTQSQVSSRYGSVSPPVPSYHSPGVDMEDDDEVVQPEPPCLFGVPSSEVSRVYQELTVKYGALDDQEWLKQGDIILQQLHLILDKVLHHFDDRVELLGAVEEEVSNQNAELSIRAALLNEQRTRMVQLAEEGGVESKEGKAT